MPMFTPMPTQTQSNNFSERLLTWFAKHGRHDLPWQQHHTDTPNAYWVWVSEVMLQQTQVVTVMAYFERFITSFPTVHALADASWNEVAEHWAGLGYYARARNLHKGAKQLVDIINTTGQMPQNVDDWEQIAGVGRSTAGAIVAMGLHGYGVICDGNVKRVLTRWAGIDADINKTATTQQLWQLATKLTPKQQSGHFAQAMMDMGATVCTRNKPACQRCPLQSDCVAKAQGNPTAYPVKTKKKPKPSKHSHALLLSDADGKLLWLQRPNSGIWGGLWCLPLQFIKKTNIIQKTNAIQKAKGDELLTDGQDDVTYEQEHTLAEQVILEFLKQQEQQKSDEPAVLQANTTDANATGIKHTLTHFHWHINHKRITLNDEQVAQLSDVLQMAGCVYQWLDAPTALTLGVPKAMVKLFTHV